MHSPTKKIPHYIYEWNDEFAVSISVQLHMKWTVAEHLDNMRLGVTRSAALMRSSCHGIYSLRLYCPSNSGVIRLTFSINLFPQGDALPPSSSCSSSGMVALNAVATQQASYDSFIWQVHVLLLKIHCDSNWDFEVCWYVGFVLINLINISTRNTFCLVFKITSIQHIL